MSRDDPIAIAMRQPAGAEFRRCALQVNPRHYSGTYRGRPSTTGDDAAYSQALVDKAAALGVTVLAVTDHNHVGGVAAIQHAARERPINVFPGFELTSTEGIHVLCLYPLDFTLAQLERCLGEFGVRTTTTTSEVCDKPFAELLTCVRDQGGISIAAHVTNKNGLFQALHGRARIRAWKDEKNRNPDYRRRHTPESDLAVAVLNARDVQSPDDLDDPAATCWVKMSDVGVEGLRQAFLDPGSRIRLLTAPPIEKHAELVAMTWQGGFLDNTVVRLNSNLNVLVGGRGAGKSTVIESLRHALGLDPLGEVATAIHRGIIRNVLRSGTKVSLLVRCHRPHPRDYRIERTIPNPPVVRDAQTGDVLNVTAAELLGGVEIYGQHEISELTASPEKLTRLLERFVERDDSVTPRKQELRQILERSRSQILAAREERARIDERLAALPGLEETLKRYQDAGLEKDLKEQSLLVREQRVLDTVPERLQPFRSCLEELRQALPMDRAFLSPRALKGLPGKEILADADRVLQQLSTTLEGVRDALKAALDQADQGIAAVHRRFEGRRAAVQSEYEKKLRDLQKARIDGEEFIRLRRRIEELRPLRERQSALTRTEAGHEERRRDLLAEWEDVKADEFRALERAGQRVTRRLDGRVRVRVEFAGNRESFVQLLRDEVGGRLSEAINTLRQADSLSLRAFVEACRRGPAALMVVFNIFGAQAERLAQASDATLMKVEELSPRMIWTTVSFRKRSCRACERRSVAASSCLRPTTRTSRCWETPNSFLASALRGRGSRGARESSRNTWAPSTPGR